MEDNGQNSMISMAVTLIIVLLVASVAFMIYRAGKQTATTALNDVSELAVTLEESKFTDFEGQTIKGVQVISILNNLKGEEVCLKVVNKGGSASTYNYTDESLATESTLNIYETQVKKSPNYINPNANFLCTVDRSTATDSIVMLTFTQQ